MKKKESDKTPAITDGEKDGEFVESETSMVDIVVRIKDDDTFGENLI